MLLLRIEVGVRIDDALAQGLDLWGVGGVDRDLPRLHRCADLAQLETRDINWGVVTNKPRGLTEPLMRDLDLGGVSPEDRRKQIQIHSAIVFRSRRETRRTG